MRFGISRDGPNIIDMQQDRFQQAANILANRQQNENVPDGPKTPKKKNTCSSSNKPCTPVTPIKSLLKIANKKCKFASLDCYKYMCEQYHLKMDKRKISNQKKFLRLLTIKQ